MKKMMVSLILVISMFSFAAESAPSATVGYVKYSNVVNATTTDLNQVAVCMTNWTNSNQIDPTSTYYNSVQKWNPATQGYAISSFQLGAWRNTFTIAAGDAIVLNAKSNHDLVVAGTLPNVQYNLIVNATLTDLNHIMLPMSKGALSTSALLGADLGTAATVCNSIQKWNNLTQGYAISSYQLGAWRNVFNTYIGDPLMLNMVTAKTWPTVAGKEEVLGAGEDYVYSAPKGLGRQIITLLEKAGGGFYSLADTGDGKVVWDAHIVARPAEIIRWNAPATGYVFEDYGIPALASIVDIQWFATPWIAGDVLFTRVKDEGAKLENQYTVTLDGDTSPTMIGFDTTFGAGTDHAIAPFHTPLSISLPAAIEDNMMPTVTELHQNYPNPFNPTTTIKFDLAAAGNVKLNVYNYNGQLVKSLVNGTMNAGYHSVNFDAANLSAGVYYYTMETAGKAMTQKMVLVK